MRLGLDEHYSAQIAGALRERGHDVSAVQERPEMRGLDGRELLATMQAERSALLTENVADFMPIVQDLAARGEDHWGSCSARLRGCPALPEPLETSSRRSIDFSARDQQKTTFSIRSGGSSH